MYLCLNIVYFLLSEIKGNTAEIEKIFAKKE
jgi:hypothetical protein